MFSSNTKLNGISVLLGMLRLNVVTKNPTPAVFPGSPSEISLVAHLDVSNPGRCHPSLSPKSPPSLNTPRTLSGKLSGVEEHAI